MVISQIRKPRLREDQLACSPTAPTGRMGGHRIPESTATTVLSLCFVASQISRNPELVEKPAHAFFSHPQAFAQTVPSAWGTLFILLCRIRSLGRGLPL